MKTLAHVAAGALAAGILLPGPAAAQPIELPQAIEAEEGTVIVYQPQIETFKRDVITGRAAMALEITSTSPRPR